MRIFRIICSWVLILYVAGFAAGELFLLVSGFGGVLLISNYIILLFLLTAAVFIHPWFTVLKRKAASIVALLCLIAFGSGIFLEVKRVRYISTHLSHMAPVSYFYSELNGIWIDDPEFLQKYEKLLSQDDWEIDWKESSWFWVSGGRACTCGAGQPLTLRHGEEVIYFKHGYIQIHGFVSQFHSALREFQEELGDRVGNAESYLSGESVDVGK